MSSKRNPLAVVFKVLGTIGSVIGLSSLAENWFNNLVKWQGFLAQVIEAYRRIVYPVFDFTLGWIWPDIPRSVCDYLAVGCVVAAAFFRSSKISLWPSKIDTGIWGSLFESKRAKTLFGLYAGVAVVLIQIAIWPWMIFASAAFYYTSDQEGRSQIRSFFSWLAASAIGIAVLFAINARLAAPP